MDACFPPDRMKNKDYEALYLYLVVCSPEYVIRISFTNMISMRQNLGIYFHSG
jgi:hypothetical protein